MRLCVFEDAGVSNLEPLSLTRPVSDLWLGTSSLLRRQQRYFAAEQTAVLIRPLLANLCRQNQPELVINDSSWLRKGGGVLVNARWLPPAEPPVLAQTGAVGLVGEQIAYLVLPPGERRDCSFDQLPRRLLDWKQSLPQHEAGGQMLDYPWHLVEANSWALEQDYGHWKREKPALLDPAPLTILGPVERVVIDAQARIEPHVVIDTTRGPVLIDREAHVHAFSRLQGPCYIGERTQILAGHVRGGSIGPECRVGGEFETSIMQGYSNKYHEGFLGHSYVGAWVNFGAGTQVSDLRNDYAPIVMTIAGKKVPTDLRKIGAYMGDHTRTSIGALVNTGTVAGPFSQLLTSGSLLPRVLPAFCLFGHGQVQKRTDLNQMIETAAMVLSRRGQQWTEVDTEFVFALYESTEMERQRVLLEIEQKRLRRVV